MWLVPIHEAPTGLGIAVRALRKGIVEWVLMMAIAVALAALGPFGSFELGSFGARLAYWLPAALIGYGIFRPITLAAAVVARRLELPEVPALMIGNLVAAIPGSLAMAYLGGYRFGSSLRTEVLFQLYLQVALIGILVTLVFVLIERRSTVSVMPGDERAHVIAAVAQDTAHNAPAAPFLERLPASWRDQLVALEMEDHYVRAHGPDSSVLILLRMRDAEAELSGIEGFRIHRSWWVAHGAIERVVRDGRNIRLRLRGGLEAPVARDRVDVLKRAGLF